MINILKYSDIKGIERIKLDSLLEWDFNPNEIVWMILDTPGQDEEEKVFSKFNIHPLVIEDIRRGRFINESHSKQHHPKIEDFEKYLFIIFHKIEALPNGINFNQKQLNTILGQNFIITISYECFKTIDKISQMMEKNPVSFRKGPDFIFHLILEEITDKSARFLDLIEEKIEKTENLVFTDPSQNILNLLLQIKKQLSKFRRTISYQKEILFKLAGFEFSLISMDETVYYRNVLDHLSRTLDLVELNKDIVQGLIDGYLSSISNKLNEIMKILTIFTTIIMPLSFIAGVYGMNFRFMPELEWPFGYPLVIFLMVLITVGMLVFFKKKKWF